MKLLVGVDFSEATEKIVKKAGELAKELSAQVWLIHVTKPEPADLFIAGQESGLVENEADPQAVRDSIAKRFHNEHRQIQQIADRLRKSGLDATALLMQGATVDVIMKEASKLDIDTIIVGSHGHGAMHQLLVGSVSEGIIHNSERPVLVIPTHNRT
jgi:nucleotide-binding universal stress UspA family protein